MSQKIIIAVSKNPTADEMNSIEKARQILVDSGLKVELIGTRPNDR